MCPLSIERNALVQRLAKQGYFDDQIADLLRIKRATVTRVRDRAHRDALIRAEHARGKAVWQIAEQFQVTVSTVRHAVAADNV
jgi:DNA-binding NarL/FixJ family response regulator